MADANPTKLCECGCGLAPPTSKTTRTDRRLKKGEQPRFISGHNSRTDHPMRSHGLANTPTYVSWRKMKERCTNPASDKWRYYGGRGIRLCERWLIFAMFLEDVGARPSEEHSLDRIDNNGNYEPGNCRWATRDEQLSNRSDNVFVSFHGERITIGRLAKRYGLSHETVRKRWLRGETEDHLVRAPHARLPAKNSARNPPDQTAPRTKALS